MQWNYLPDATYYIPLSSFIRNVNMGLSCHLQYYITCEITISVCMFGKLSLCFDDNARKARLLVFVLISLVIFVCSVIVLFWLYSYCLFFCHVYLVNKGFSLCEIWRNITQRICVSPVLFISFFVQTDSSIYGLYHVMLVVGKLNKQWLRAKNTSSVNAISYKIVADH